MPDTRIFFTSDVHGSEKTYSKFLNAGKFYKADVLILGGDITGKMVIPIISVADGTFKTHFLGSDYTFSNKDEVQKMEDHIRNTGYYPHVLDERRLVELGETPNEREKLFTGLMVEQVKMWVRIAEERLRASGIKCFILPGNDDRLEIDEAIADSDYVTNPEGKVVAIDAKHQMISSGYSNMTPWKCPRDISEKELEKRIENMVGVVSNMNTCLFTFHCPPYNSGLDTAPRIDEQLRPVVSPAGGFEMTQTGSQAVRNAIEKYQPLLGLHGHIHESRGTRKIGRTLCINPGSEYSEGILRGAIVNLGEDRIKSYLLTYG